MARTKQTARAPPSTSKKASSAPKKGASAPKKAQSKKGKVTTKSSDTQPLEHGCERYTVTSSQITDAYASALESATATILAEVFGDS